MEYNIGKTELLPNQIQTNNYGSKLTCMNA